MPETQDPPAKNDTATTDQTVPPGGGAFSIPGFQDALATAIKAKENANPATQASPPASAQAGDAKPAQGDPPADKAKSQADPQPPAAGDKKPAAHTPPKPPGTDSVDDDSAPKKSSDWQRLKASRDEATTRAAELERRLKAIEDGSDLPESLRKIRDEHSQFDNLLKQVALDRHPAFSKQFEERKAHTLNLVKTVMGSNADKIIGILQMPPSDIQRQMLDAALEDATPTQIGAVVNAFSDLSRMQAEREAALARSNDTWAELNTRQKAEAQALQQARSKHLDAELARWKERGSDFFANRDGDADHNRDVQRRLDLARAVYDGSVDASEVARNVAWGVVAPELLGQLQSANAEIQRLQAEVQKLSSAQPGSGGTPPPSDDSLSSMSAGDRLQAMLQSAMPK